MAAEHPFDKPSPNWIDAVKEDKAIIEGNALIAKFVGWVEIPESENGNIPKHYERGQDWMNTIDDFKYRTSWDWLMPCVKKFDYLAENKVIPFSNNFEYWCDKIENAITRTYEIEPVFKIMVEAIEWYNSQSKTNNNG